MRIRRERDPKPGGDWYERMVRVWEEDDAPVPDRERLHEAWTRITGRPIFGTPREKHDAGDAVYQLHWGGWVCADTCEGGFIAIVAEWIP